MADFDATRVGKAKEAALAYMNDRRLELPRAHELAVVIEAQELEIRKGLDMIRSLTREVLLLQKDLNRA
jgi:hypothetical protein